MVLIPIAVFFLVLAVIQLARRNWKTAGLHACGAAIAALLYVCWAQSNVIRGQQEIIKDRSDDLIKAHKQLGKARNRTSPLEGTR